MTLASFLQPALLSLAMDAPPLPLISITEGLSLVFSSLLSCSRSLDSALPITSLTNGERTERDGAARRMRSARLWWRREEAVLKRIPEERAAPVDGEPLSLALHGAPRAEDAGGHGATRGDWYPLSSSTEGELQTATTTLERRPCRGLRRCSRGNGHTHLPVVVGVRVIPLLFLLLFFFLGDLTTD